MDFGRNFPLIFLINLGRREDRRHEAEAKLAELGIQAERFPAIDARWKKGRTKSTVEGDGEEVRGYSSAGRYALALTQRLAIREARRRRAPSVLLLEDDVILHPNFNNLIRSVELPDDWGIFYFGCTHNVRPKWSGSRLVRCLYAVDTHAVAVHSRAFKEVMAALDRHHKPELGVAKASDQFLALLHRRIPSYSCHPNLAWQGVVTSDLVASTYSNYCRDGGQKNFRDASAGLLAELVEGKVEAHTEIESKSTQAVAGRFPKLGLLFLTRGDVNHPAVWAEFVKEAPSRVRIFSHPKNPKQIESGFLRGTAIGDRHETSWGDISLVRATRSLLKAALQDNTLTHFILLSESCIPVRPLPQILRHLELDPRSQFGFKSRDEAPARILAGMNHVTGVPPDCWRYTSQWWLLDRAAAVFAVGQDYTRLFEAMNAADEAYFGTVLSIQGFPIETEVIRKDVTWTYWKKGETSPTEWLSLPVEKIESIVNSGSHFARKFPRESSIGKLHLHRSHR